MRLLFAGTPSPAVPALQKLVSEHDVVGVLTMPDARGKRGKTLHRSPVARAAEEMGLDTFKTATLKTAKVQAWVQEKNADAVAVVAYGALVPPGALELTRHGWINLHFSHLPAYRGAAPVQRAIQDGRTETGLTVFRIDEGLDTGPILAARTERLGERENSGEALERLANLGAGFLSETLSALHSGMITPVEQSEQGASYAPQLSSAEGKVDWNTEATRIDQHIRAFTPDPGAWAVTTEGLRIRIASAHPGDTQETLRPGVFELRGNEVAVGTTCGVLVLEAVAPAGRKLMDGAAWLRGYRGTHAFEVRS